jgi:hypothetical protein
MEWLGVFVGFNDEGLNGGTELVFAGEAGSAQWWSLKAACPPTYCRTPITEVSLNCVALDASQHTMRM